MSKSFYGVGFNSGGKYKSTGSGAKAYETWRIMLRRAYCPKVHARQPAYVGCSVADEWLEYQNFAEWFENHEYSDCGYQFTKGLLIPDNKIYAPNRCVFVPVQLNNLVIDNSAMRGQCHQGVDFDKRGNKFEARIKINGKKKRLGHFNTEQEAYHAYKKAKEAYVKEKALEWQDRIADNVFDALMSWELNPK